MDQQEFHGENKMLNEKLNDFGKILVRDVRDAAIRACDINCQPSAQSIEAKHWRKLGIENSIPLARAMIPECVDAAVFFLLNAIDQGTLRLQFIADDGSTVDLTRESLGELAGWYFVDDGFRAAFSEERIIHYDDHYDDTEEKTID